MKLIPSAKPIRIRIISGGEEHSSIDSLRHNYSLGDILPLVKDGRLHKWLLRVGEKNAADSAYILIGSNTYANSRDMVELTASIFNTKAISIEDLQRLWQKQYPRTFINYVKAYGLTVGEISSARELFNSIGSNNCGLSTEEWEKIFVSTMKKTALSAVLEDFKKFKYTKPMDSLSWLEVLKHHSNLASDKDLYIMAQIAYEDPALKEAALEWYLKSARTYPKAKEWINNQIHNIKQFNDISSARKLYGSIKVKNVVMDTEEWQHIFVDTLKKMPLSAVLADFKEFKYAKPMDYLSWLEVFQHHSDVATDKELYHIAQATYDDPSLKRRAEEWYRKSANTYYEAKEWVKNNLKKNLDPMEQELFDTFERNPHKFTERFFNSAYPQNLVRFLNILSSLYRTTLRPIKEQIMGCGKYTKYLFLVEKLYNVNYSNFRKNECIRDLKQLPYNMNSAYHFSNYATLNLIISSLENEKFLWGVQLWKLNYQQVILFIAGLAKTELENEK